MKIDLSHFPIQMGVYLMKGKDGKVLYIGKANNLKMRLRQYFTKTDTREMVPYLLQEVAAIDTLVVTNEKEALLLENNLIKKHQPKYNVLLKDDKTFISLFFTKHKWPMLKITRGRKRLPEAFGPYTSATKARQTYDLILKLFPLRQCSDAEFSRRQRPCLLYDIKKCVAPCVGKCTAETYASLVEGAKELLKGKDSELLYRLQKKMEEASENQEYEKAGELLHMIRSIEHVTTVQHVDIPQAKDLDVLGLYREGNACMIVKLLFREGKLIGSEHFSFYQILSDDAEIIESFLLQHYKENLPLQILIPLSLTNLPVLKEILSTSILYPQKGDKKKLITLAYQNAIALFKKEEDSRSLTEKLLLDLAQVLQLTRYPRRIDCVDTSHISGANPVAALVSFVNGKRDKKRQRYFKITSSSTGNDLALMKEALLRHFKKGKERNDFCDLLIVDGGRSHLHLALEVFQELEIANIDVIGVAKYLASHSKGLTQEKVYIPYEKEPLSISHKSPLLFLLQKIRDEAHRVALSFHRKRRTNETLKSSLDSLKGIGPVKKKLLLQHFGSVKRMKEATKEELQQVKGLNKNDINNILQIKKEA